MLASYGLDSLHDDSELGAIADFAASLCEAPIALVSLVEEERQRFLARHGLDAGETPRDISFCAHAMLLADGMVVTDARGRRTLRRQSAGHRPAASSASMPAMPLVSEEGAPLGTLCVIDSDTAPRRPDRTADGRA